MSKLVDPKDTSDVGIGLLSLKLIVIAVGLWFIWQFVELGIGNNVTARKNQDFYDADQIDKAFLEYTGSNDGQAPIFHSAQEVTRVLSPKFAKLSTKFDDHGRAIGSSGELEAISNKSVWNTSVSGAKIFEDEKIYPATLWLFYFQQSSDLFCVAFCDGHIKPARKDRLNEVIGKPPQ